jgi:hypothetical protein
METRENIEKKVFDSVKSGDVQQQEDLKKEINCLGLSELKELFPEYSEEAEAAVEYEVKQDQDYDSPREWDQLGTMWCHHNRYRLGDKDGAQKAYELVQSCDLTPEDAELLEDASGLKYAKDRKTVLDLMQKYDVAIAMPLFLYDHSGITMSTGNFGDRWDSGQVGVIFVSKERLKEEGVLGDSEWREKYHAGKSDEEIVQTILKAEVSEYDDYLTGNVWGYQVKVYEDVENSCWGFYGDSGEKEANNEAEAYAEGAKKTVITNQIFEAAEEKVALIEQDSKMDEVFKIASTTTGLDVNTLKGAVAALKEASAKIGGPKI